MMPRLELEKLKSHPGGRLRNARNPIAQVEREDSVAELQLLANKLPTPVSRAETLH